MLTGGRLVGLRTAMWRIELARSLKTKTEDPRIQGDLAICIISLDSDDCLGEVACGTAAII